MKSLPCPKCNTGISALRIGSYCFTAIKCPSCKAAIVYPKYQIIGLAAFLVIAFVALFAANVVTDYVSQGKMNRSALAHFGTLGAAYALLSYGYGRLLLRKVTFSAK